MPSPLKRFKAFPQGLRLLLMGIGALIVVIIIGTTGYMELERLSFSEALYMTVITISTVGFKEVHNLDLKGAYFTMFIVLIGASTVVFVLTGLFELVLSEFFNELWEKRKMKARIDQLDGHFIVCGYGRVGRNVAVALAAQGKDFVVIEKNPELVLQCVEAGYLVLDGDATQGETLSDAGIERSSGLVSALRSDADNLYVTLTARVMRDDLLLVARAGEQGAEEKLTMVGADRVISPYHIAGRRMANLLTHPWPCEMLDDFLEYSLRGYQLLEVEILQSSILTGTTLKDSGIQDIEGLIVISIKKGSDGNLILDPPPASILETGDFLVVLGDHDHMKSFEIKLGTPLEKAAVNRHRSHRHLPGRAPRH